MSDLTNYYRAILQTASVILLLLPDRDVEQLRVECMCYLGIMVIMTWHERSLSMSSNYGNININGALMNLRRSGGTAFRTLPAFKL